MIKTLYLAALAAVIIGCATAGGASGNAPVQRRNAVLTADEIATAHADVGTAYDAVARLRPNWMAARGPEMYAKVYVEGQLYGDLASLRNLPAYQIAGARYYDVSQSAARFGLRAGDGGAIEITLRNR